MIAAVLLGAVVSFAGADRIEVVPLGSIGSATLRYIARELANRFPAHVRILNARKLPAETSNPDRAQQRAPAILDLLVSGRRNVATGEPQPGRLLAITDADIYAPGLDFVFGQADAASRVALVSLYRLQKEDCGLSAPGHPRVAANPSLWNARLIREAVHETGHTYGLVHCPNPRCVMFFSNIITDADRRTSNLCPQCSAELPWTTSRNRYRTSRAR